MDGKCIVSSCGKAASKCCGSCGLVRYCSTDCQKKDWKEHHKKSECLNLNKLNELSPGLTEKEIYDVVDRVSKMSDRLSPKGELVRSIHLLNEFVVFVRDRCGRLDCNDARSMIGDGVKLNNIPICRLLVKLGEIYFLNVQGSSESDNLVMSYLSEARELLIQRKDAGEDDMVMWKMLFLCDESLYHLYARRCQLEKAKYHAVHFVASARQYKGPDQVNNLIRALSKLSASLQLESDYPESLAVAEESYLLASKHYSPAHKMVLQASRPLIDCLTVMKDYSTADTYCRMNCANVIDPMNAGEYDVVDRVWTMDQLVEIWLAKEPDDDEIVEKALADEAIDLSRKAYALDKESWQTQINFICLSRLCRVLLKANQLTEETEGLLHQLVKTCATNIYFDGYYTLASIGNLGDYYLRLNKSLPMGEKSTLVQENIELCEKKLLELESCNVGSVGYVKISQKIKPYFKNNSELCI